MSEARDRYHHGNLRQALVTHALDLLADEGLAGLSLRKVAARAGVSRSAPYHHFADKEALVAAVVQHGFEELTAAKSEAARGIVDDLARLRAAGEAYVRFALRHPALYKLMFGPKALDPSRHPETAAAADAAFDMLVGMVTAGQQSGAIGGDDPMTVALTAWSTCHGMAGLMLDKLRHAAPDEDCDGPAFGSLSEEAVLTGVLQTLEAGLAPR